MSNTMRAARWYGPKDIRVEDVEVPEVKAGQVKIKVEWCGICGSDLHEYMVGPIFIPVGGVHPITKEEAPIIMGHEFAGVVADKAEDVEHLDIGDKVVLEPIWACGECEKCKRGDYQLCDQLGFHGLAGGGGGLAEYTTFPAELVYKLPENVSTKEGALVEPIAVAVHSLRRGRFMQGETALVTGAGPIGLSTILALKSAGAQKIISVELKEARKNYALDFGADVVFDPTEVDVVEEVMKLTDNKGVDIAFETTGVQAGFEIAVNSIDKGARVVVTSIWEEAIEFHLNSLVLAEKEIIGTLAYNSGVFPATISLVEDGRIDAPKMITKEVQLENVVKEGFDELIAHKDKHIKIIVTPSK